MRHIPVCPICAKRGNTHPSMTATYGEHEIAIKCDNCNHREQVNLYPIETLIDHLTDALVHAIDLRYLEDHEVVDRWTKISMLKRGVEDLKRAVDEAIVERIQDDGHDLELGDTRLYVGHPKKTSCLGNAKVLKQLLESCHGDIDAVADCLGANAWKHGTVREKIGNENRYNELFSTVTQDKTSEGKRKKPAVQRASETYSKGALK